MQRCDAVQKLNLLEWIILEANLHFQHAHKLRPLTGPVIERLKNTRRRQWICVAILQALKCLKRRRVIRLLCQYLSVQLDRSLRVPEVPLVKLRDPVLVGH